MNVTKKTTEWVAAKIITEKQRAAILTHEAGRGGWSMGPLLLGIFCIGLGMISMIAANWQGISDNIKLGGAFLILAGLLGGAYSGFRREKPFVFEGCLFAAFLFCGAVIGLVGQVFHLNGNLHGTLFLWALAGIPLAIISGRPLVGLLWVPMALYGFVPEDWWRSLGELYETQPMGNTIILGAWLAAVAGVLGFVRFAFVRAIQKWAYILLYANFVIGDFLLSDKVSALAGFVVTILFLIVAAFSNVRSGNRWAFKGSLFLIAARILILYLQVFISLAFTGIGLIIGGGVVLGLWGIGRWMNRRFSPQAGGTHE